MIALLLLTSALIQRTDGSAVDSALCAEANSVAAAFCSSVEDWTNVVDVTHTCLQAEDSLDKVLTLLDVEHFHICTYPGQLQTVCNAVDANDHMTTCESILDIASLDHGVTESLESAARRTLDGDENDSEEAAMDPLVCSAGTAVAATFCAQVDDWTDVNDVTQRCLQAEVAINTMLSFIDHEHLMHVCDQHEQLEAICASVNADDDSTTCELYLAMEESAQGERRNLRRRSCGCFDEMTVVQTRKGEKFMRDVIAGEEILTCEPGVYTRVFANVDHQDTNKVSLIQLETDLSSLTLTSSHFVLSKGQYVRAGDMKLGMEMDGETITRVSPALGRRFNVVTLRQDIVVNGVCGTWVDSSFAAILYLAPLNRLMNPLATAYPQFIFSTTQKLADVVVPLLDAQVLSYHVAAIIMIVVSFLLAAGNFAVAMGTLGFFYGHLNGKVVQ